MEGKKLRHEVGQLSWACSERMAVTQRWLYYTQCLSTLNRKEEFKMKVLRIKKEEKKRDSKDGCVSYDWA